MLNSIYPSLKSLAYLLKSRPYGLEKPIVIQFPVIDICNSQCQMCRIWENKKSNDISPEQLRIGLRKSLFSEVTAVGLNGGEPTLRKDLALLASVLYEELPKLRSISLITNAYNFQEVIQRIGEVGEVVLANGGHFDVMVSLDGYREVHDRVRGKPGNFDRAQKVIDYASSSPLVNNVRIGCTIIKENVYGLADLFEFCQARGVYIKYRLGIPHQRLYTQNLNEPYALTFEEKYHITEFLEGLIAHYEPSEHQKFFYRSLIDQILHNAPRKAGCDWQHRGATITSKGELLYCAVQSKVLGKITDQDAERAYFGNENHLNDIIHNHCDKCTHDYVGIPPQGEFVRQVAMRAVKKLHAEHFLRNVFRKAARGTGYLKWRFEKRVEKYRHLGQIQKTWPEGGRGKRILVCGWYGTETLGDKAILGGILHSLRTGLGVMDLVLVSLFPYVSEMSRRQMAELADAHIVDPELGVQLAGEAELVVFGGGPLMALEQTAEMLAIFEAAKRAGRHTLVAGCGVGPLGDHWHNAAIGQLLKLADVRIYRDKRSRELAAQLGVDTTSDQVAEDPAFTWLNEQEQKVNRAKDLDVPKILLLGLRDFPHAQYARHLSSAECRTAKLRYEGAVLEALTQLVKLYPDLVIRPLPMCTNHFGGDDRWFYRRLFRGQHHLTPNLDLSLLGAELAPQAYCEAYAEATAALTMRFHSVVFALGLGVPTVAIDYTLGRGKVRSLAERFGVSHRSLTDIDADFLVKEMSILLAEPQAPAIKLELGFPAAIHAALTNQLSLQ
jgi:polysaccharide pyruvyl transferase WcaK-like protein/MoaA/NifB/PqqE/SkfB family radical SAM enzyme